MRAGMGLKPLEESGRHRLIDALRRILARLDAQGVPSGAGVGDRLSGTRTLHGPTAMSMPSLRAALASARKKPLSF